MLWILQKTRNGEEGFDELIGQLTNLEIPFILAKPDTANNKILKEDTLEELHLANEEVMICGSYSLNRIAQKQNLQPGIFWNDNFTVEQWLKNWSKENFLNENPKVSTIENVQSFIGNLFFRPFEDTKAFCGKIFNYQEFDEFRKNLKKTSILNQQTKIIMSPVKKIFKEHRFFIVNGKVITGSLYKQNGQYYSSSFIDFEAQDFAQKMTDKWSPDKAFVLDVATTEDGLKIVEVNCFNVSGFYQSNIYKIITSIEDLFYYKFPEQPCRNTIK